MSRPANFLLLPLLSLLISSTSASPIPADLFKRDLSSGAKAGLGIGIVVAGVLVLCILVFFTIHLRRRAHNNALNRERAILAGEKNPDGSDKFDKFAPEIQPMRPGVRRNKSVKDRLMGPLYRGSMIEMPPIARTKFGASSRQSTVTLEGDDHSFINKPWANSSPRPSFSSKRATRMMMMM